MYLPPQILFFKSFVQDSYIRELTERNTRRTNYSTIDLDMYIDEAYTDMSNDFEDIRMLDNFYQTSSFFPMPVVLVSTLSEGGETNLGPYSLCFPHIIAERYAMMLICREDSSSGVSKSPDRVGLWGQHLLLVH
ncbi:MAG: hypothetical protein ACFFDD_05095 [Promethearchaeota archaeon]